MHEELKIRMKVENKIAYLQLEGFINMETSDELFETLKNELIKTENCIRFIIDVSALEYVSSAGVSVLMDLYEQIEAKDGKICFLHMRPDIRRVFEMVGFMKYFGEASSMDQAIKYIYA